MLVFQQWLMCYTCLYHYMLILCCFVRYPPTTVSPHTVLSWQALYQVIAPLFWDTLSLMRKTLYKHPAYLCLYCSFSDLSLIRYCSLWDIAIRRKLVIFQASSSLDRFIWRKPGNILSHGGCRVWRDTCYSKIVVIYSQIKTLNGPMFCDSARSSISLSFREMKLIRKGQRASQPSSTV